MILVCLLSVSCEKEVVRTDVYSVLRDVTDPLTADVNADEITSAMRLEESDKNIILRYSELSDIDINIVNQTIYKAPVTGLLGNEVVNKQNMRLFKQEVTRVLTPKDSLISAPYSAIFTPIIKEVEYLHSLDTNGDKILVVYSDLFENDPSWVSFYRTNDLMMLNNHPEQIVKRYLKKASLSERIDDVAVHIVYIPKNIEENKRFNAIRMCYMRVFDTLGIPITFSANLTHAPIEL